MDAVRLPKVFEDEEEAARLNARLTQGEVTLDWSQVDRWRDEALDMLVQGLDLASDTDALGAGTMGDALAEAVQAAFARMADGPAVRAPTPAPSAPAAHTTPAPAAPATPALRAPTPAELRDRLHAMVVRDLLGPAGGPDEELEDGRVNERYLVGLLAPRRLRVGPEEDERLAVGGDGDTQDGATEDEDAAVPSLFPSSAGLSFCVASEGEGARLTVAARWGRYLRVTGEAGEGGAVRPAYWKRTQMEGVLELELTEGRMAPVPVNADQPDVVVRGVANRVDGDLVVSLFLVNGQDEPPQRKDEAWLFQPELIVEAPDGAPVFRQRPARELSSEGGLPTEDRAMAMRYRDRVEFAVGHNVSVHAEPEPGDPHHTRRVEIRVVPYHDVLQQESPDPSEQPGLEDLVLDMKTLAETPRHELGARLRALPEAYGRWIEAQRARLRDPKSGLGSYGPEAKAALEAAETALSRIGEGLAVLAADDKAAEAFRFANRAMWLQRVHTVLAERRRRGDTVELEDVDVPENRRWRVFQLAFILLNLDSVTVLHHRDRTDARRAIADLLWFPTGGGKTEAYLGLAAYVMGLRRLQGEVAGRSGEHGVAVLMRYTLRLLTLQQFQRATALICACEVIRREARDEGDLRWGHEPFRIGLWVGAKSTPNKTEHAAEALKQVRRSTAFQPGARGSPVQLKSCPWCGSRIEPGRHVKVETVKSGHGRTLTYCGDPRGACPFSERGAPVEGLPVVVVDEEIYRRLPTLLIATVDKFAQMPWNGLVQMLFGQVDGRCPRHGFTSPELEDGAHNRKGTLPATKVQPHAPLRPPDLIIQDELHLISGPLGTLTGLYETAVDELCTWEVGGSRVRPKVIASTATVRRAQAQIHALFLRRVQVFPPPGLDAGDSFFALERPASVRPGRRYLGICAPGRRLKAALIRTYVAHLAAAQKLYEDYGARVDPWMTLVGYFNSMRELAGMRRLVDDDVKSRLRREAMKDRGLTSRYLGDTQELTSRLTSTQIPDVLDWLELGFDPENGARRKKGEGRTRRPIDVLLATNMVSVGVDVARLGLMLVAGQPKTTAEYIQATSRVGRRHPGLVCTVYNWARPRDLSHFESFEHYHETFYEHVEALSVTPFAPRSLDRGLTALLVALVRLQGGRYNPNDAAERIDPKDPLVRRAVDAIARRAAMVEESKAAGDEVRALLEARLDHWAAEAAPAAGKAKLGYKAARDGVTRGLLRLPGKGGWDAFTLLNSLRDVEPTAPLILDSGNELDEQIRDFTGAHE